MKRANFVYGNQEYNGFIIIETICELFDFYNEKTNGMFKDAAQKLVRREHERSRGETNSNTTDPMVYAVETLNNSSRGLLYRHAGLFASYCECLENAINRGEIVVINPHNMVSWFTLSKGYPYTVVSKKEQYTKEDIRLMRFPDGYHWYAKISQIDVVIDGEQKWEARWVAQKKAEEFLEILNKRA